MPSLILRPNAAGTYQAFSTFGSPPSHWQGTSDQSDATGVVTTNTTNKETQNLASSSDLGTINSVAGYMRAKATGTSTAEAAVFIWRTYNTDYEGTPFPVGRSFFSNYSEVRTTNPNTSSAWTWTEVNALEIGARAALLVPVLESIEVSEFWIVVDYTPYEKQVSDSGSLASETVTPRGIIDYSRQATTGARTRVVEVVRVGSTDLHRDYPGKQVVRLIDRAMLYEGGALRGLSSAKTFAKMGNRGMVTDERMVQLNPTAPRSQNVRGLNLYYAVQAGMVLPEALEDLHNRIRGKRLSGISVDVWDQISGAYLGPQNTDSNATLVLPTDTQFVEVLQWKLAGGGYSDCFNGERAAGTPGLMFYFPCNEGSGSSISSFPGISGQRATLPSGWSWYDSGYFNRPALRKTSGTEGIVVQCADPVGFRSFQFLYYADDPVGNTYTLFDYGVPYQTGFPASGVFRVSVENGVLRATAGGETDDGSTALAAGKWYLIQVNTEAVVTGAQINPPYRPLFSLKTDVYISGVLEANASAEDQASAGFGNGAQFNCQSDDALDELRHLSRALYTDEISNYSTFLRIGRLPKKSEGKLGSPGW